MLNFKPVLAAAVIALAAPLVMTSPSLAQGIGTKAQGAHGGGGGGGGHMGRGGGGGGHMGRGGGGGGGHMSRGGGFGGGGRHMAGGGWHGGGHHGGWHGGHHRHFGGFYPGFGFGLGSAWGWGSPYYSYSSPYYYDDYGYDDDGPAVEVVPSGGSDVAYCQQRFKSYDVRSGTYLGYDGKRHPCP